MRCANSPSRSLSHILPRKQTRRSKVGNGKCSDQSRRRTSVKFAPSLTQTHAHTLCVLSLSLYRLPLKAMQNDGVCVIRQQTHLLSRLGAHLTIFNSNMNQHISLYAYACICVCVLLYFFTWPFSGLIMRHFLCPCDQCMGMHCVFVRLLHARWRFVLTLSFIYICIKNALILMVLSHLSLSFSITHTRTQSLSLSFSLY